MRKSIAIAACFVAMTAGAAAAQDPNQPVLGAPQSPRQASVRVQSTVVFFVPGPTGDSDAAAKAREQARRSVYEMAARECDLLRQTIASDCRLESVSANVTASRQLNQFVAQPEGWQVNGTMMFQIHAK